MREVIYPKPERYKTNTDKVCQSCGGNMRHDQVPCPDGKIGCLVIHYGFICLNCGKVFK